VAASADQSLETNFFRTLVEDVQVAFDRLDKADSEVHRREAVRTAFAAIEGVAWMYRQHVRRVADDIGRMTPFLDLALNERSYVITDQGDLIEQSRPVPLTASVRFTSRVAGELSPSFCPDFGEAGWVKLKEAIRIRNRLMHPKQSRDLSVSIAEMRTTQSAFYWLMQLATDGMEAANLAMVRFNDDAHELLDRLREGDEQTLADYRRALDETD
jgi:hypothetical protein